MYPTTTYPTLLRGERAHYTDGLRLLKEEKRFWGVLRFWEVLRFWGVLSSSERFRFWDRGMFWGPALKNPQNP
jgi:hypothetical protein